jgi:uncharacterized membrane protein
MDIDLQKRSPGLRTCTLKKTDHEPASVAFNWEGGNELYWQEEGRAVMDSSVEPGDSGSEKHMDTIRTGDRSAGFGKNRIEALTDGIFAIALTLLVLSVEVPRIPEEMVPATQLLIDLFPDFFHYILAFVVLAVIWVFHHQQFHHILHIDRTMLWLNILALMFITMVPFSSSYADTYYNQQIAGIFFSANLLVIGLLIWLQWDHATDGNRLVDPHLDPCEIRYEKQKNLIIPALAVLSIAISLMGVVWAAGIFYSLPLVLYLVQRWHDRQCIPGAGYHP